MPNSKPVKQQKKKKIIIRLNLSKDTNIKILNKTLANIIQHCIRTQLGEEFILIYLNPPQKKIEWPNISNILT